MILFDKDINFQTINNLEEIKNKWIEVFAGHLTKKERRKIYMNQYLWHIFSYEKMPCLEGAKARKAFDELKEKEYYIFYEDWVYDCDLSEYKGKTFEILNGDKINAKDFNKENENKDLAKDLAKLLKEEGDFVQDLSAIATKGAEFHARLEAILITQ